MFPVLTIVGERRELMRTLAWPSGHAGLLSMAGVGHAPALPLFGLIMVWLVKTRANRRHA